MLFFLYYGSWNFSGKYFNKKTCYFIWNQFHDLDGKIFDIWKFMRVSMVMSSFSAAVLLLKMIALPLKHLTKLEMINALKTRMKIFHVRFFFFSQTNYIIILNMINFKTEYSLTAKESRTLNFSVLIWFNAGNYDPTKVSPYAVREYQTK